MIHSPTLGKKVFTKLAFRSSLISLALTNQNNNAAGY